MSDEPSLDAVELTIAWLGNQNNRVQADDVPAFLRTMHATVTELASPPATAAEPVAASEAVEAAEPAAEFTPAVTVRKSLGSKDHILSLIDGKPYKTLRRHIGTHGLTPEQYRQRYNLKPDYPMVAENYSELRRAAAHRIGLGQQGRAARAAAAAATKPISVPAPAKAAAAAPKTKRAPRRAKTTA